MRITKVAKLIVVLSVILGLIGCASSCKDPKYARRDNNLGLGDLEQFYGEDISLAKERALLNKKVIHFGFDRFDITGENKLIVLAHTKKLLQNNKLVMRIDGHTDERGSREYNIGLGERRANAVRKIMALKGISADRLVTVSYGKEKPVALGHNEDAWQLNRRAELTYE